MARAHEMSSPGRQPICLITGATGAIGPAVVAALADTHDIRILSRRPADPALFAVPVQVYAGDIADLGALRSAAREADAIVHLAALLHIVDPPPSMRAEYERVNIDGTGAVVAAAVAEGVRRVVMMSTIAVYGEASGRRLDEESPAQPNTLYGDTKLRAERVALAARTAGSAPLATVLRSAAVYGPRVKGNYERLVHAMARGRFMPVGRGDNMRTVVFEQDLARAAALAVRHPSAAGRIYNVSDGMPHPLREIIAAIAAALGRRPPRWYLPSGPVRAVLGAASFIDRRPADMLSKYLEEVAIDATRIQCELGFRPAVSLAEGWTMTVNEMRRLGRPI